MKEMKLKLYAFNWTSGGWNQVYAKTKRGALKQIEKEFPNYKNSCLKGITNLHLIKDKDVDDYWKRTSWD